MLSCFVVIWDAHTLTCFDRILVTVWVVSVLITYANEGIAAIVSHYV